MDAPIALDRSRLDKGLAMAPRRHRLLVHQAIAQDFVAAVRERAVLPVGDPLDPETKVGAIITPEHRARIEGYVAENVVADYTEEKTLHFHGGPRTAWRLPSEAAVHR